MREPVSTVRTIELPGGALVPLIASPGERIRILCGRIWLTEEGVPQDAFLASGEEVSLSRRGLAVVEALGPSRIQLIGNPDGTARLVHAVAALARRMAGLARRWRWRSPRPARGAA